MLSSGNGIVNLVPGQAAGASAQTLAVGTLAASTAALAGIAAGTSGAMAGQGGTAAMAASGVAAASAGAEPAAGLDAAAAQMAEGLATIIDGRDKVARAGEEITARARATAGRLAELESDTARLHAELSRFRDGGVPRDDHETIARSLADANGRIEMLAAELESLRAAHGSCGLLADKTAALERQLGIIRDEADVQKRARMEAEEGRAATAAVLQSAIERSFGAAALVDGAITAVHPFLGETSPLLVRLRRARDLLSGAGGMTASPGARPLVSPPVEALSAGEDLPAWPGEKAGVAFSEINGKLTASIFRSLDDIHPGEKGLREVFVVAALRLLNSGVAGARELVELVFSTLLNPQDAEYAKRGLVHQVIRTVHILDSGRKVDEVNRIQFRYVEFRGWWIDKGVYSIMRRDMRSNVDADARDGETIMEIKGTRINGITASLLKEMLLANEDWAATVKYNFNRPQSGPDHVQLAVHIANQFIRYRLLIQSKKIRKLEWHITSSEPISDDVLEAIYGFFPDNGVEVIWYRDVLTAGGRTLLPSSRTKGVVPASGTGGSVAAPDAVLFEEAYSGVPAAVSGDAPLESATRGEALLDGGEAATAGGVSSGQITDDGPAGRGEDAGVGATGESGVGDESAGPDTPRGAPQMQAFQTRDDVRALLSAIVYADSRYRTAAGHDYSIIEGFLDHTVEGDRWMETGRTLGQGGTAPDYTLKLFEQWSEGRDLAAAPQARPDPWDDVREDKAQRRFNYELGRVTGKNQIRWDLRTTQGIQNADIIRVLVALSAAKPAKKNQRLKDRMGEFITYLRTSYSPGSYFKTEVDGPRLVDIMKHLIWLDNGSGE